MNEAKQLKMLATFLAGQNSHMETMLEAIAGAKDEPERLKNLAEFAVPMLLRGQALMREAFPVKFQFTETRYELDTPDLSILEPLANLERFTRRG
jgi:hypothetical protein